MLPVIWGRHDRVYCGHHFEKSKEISVEVKDHYTACFYMVEAMWLRESSFSTDEPDSIFTLSADIIYSLTLM